MKVKLGAFIDRVHPGGQHLASSVNPPDRNIIFVYHVSKQPNILTCVTCK